MRKKIWQKKCPFCGNQRTKKCGKNGNGKQRYFCSDCKKYFQRQKYKTHSKSIKIWHQYVWERQTLSTLSNRYNRSISWNGRKGVKEVFSDVPVQMCQYHQLMILRRYLTMNPRLEAGKELRIISKNLCNVNWSEFELLFARWCKKWANFLKERTYNIDGKWHYTHRRLRSARRSLMTNLPYLFTYQDYPELEIPNTTNYAESFHSKIKDLLRVHRGFNSALKQKIIKEILTK